MKLNKLYSPTYEEWTVIEKKGFWSFLVNAGLPVALLIPGFFIAMHFYSALLLQTPYFSEFSANYANAMRDLNWIYMRDFIWPKILVAGFTGFFMAIILIPLYWFRFKKQSKKGKEAWYPMRKSRIVQLWVLKNNFTMMIFTVFVSIVFTIFILKVEILQYYVGDGALPRSYVDLSIAFFACLTPILLLLSIVWQSQLRAHKKLFNLKVNAIKVWPYTILFFINICILVASIFGFVI